MRRLAALVLLTACIHTPPRDRFIPTSDHSRIHVLDFGGQGQTLVLLAGLGNTAYVYSGFAPRLTQRFHIIAITRRGHGRSGAVRDYSPEAQARDIRDVLDNLRIPRAHLAGHSLAGAEMTAFARLYPDRTGSLIYLDAGYDRKLQHDLDAQHEDPVPYKQPSVADLASVDAYLAYCRRRDALPGAYLGQIWGPALEADAREQIEVLPNGTVRERMNGKDFNGFYDASAVAAPDYAKVQAPILAIYAETAGHPFLPLHADPELRQNADAYHATVIRPWTEASIRELRQAKPRARIVELHETLHHVFIQRPEQIESLIEEFLR
jgi:pimeloyl-ACP methyl ester carboxylesterase